MRRYQRLKLAVAIFIIVLTAAASSFRPPPKWTTIRNMEHVPYCISLPLEGYKENFKLSDIRAKHVFTHKTRQENEIMLWGLIRADTLSTEEYYNKYFEAAEEQGMAIEEKMLDKQNNRFYGRGYWSNGFYKTRFIEIIWLRNGELVKLNSTFSVKDSSLWYKQMARLFNQTANCK